MGHSGSVVYGLMIGLGASCGCENRQQVVESCLYKTKSNCFDTGQQGSTYIDI